MPAPFDDVRLRVVPHADQFTTGPLDDVGVEALSDQTIHPYTDLLLHDMGEGLADGRPDFEATGTEWRTPPLWGIGLIDERQRRTVPAARRAGAHHRGGHPVARRRGRSGQGVVPHGDARQPCRS